MSYSGRHYTRTKTLTNVHRRRPAFKVNLLEQGRRICLAAASRTRENKTARPMSGAGRCGGCSGPRMTTCFSDRLRSLNLDVARQLRDPKGNWFALTRRARVIHGSTWGGDVVGNP